MCFADRPQNRHDISDVIEMENTSVEDKKPDKPLPYREIMMTETFTVSIIICVNVHTKGVLHAWAGSTT